MLHFPCSLWGQGSSHGFREDRRPRIKNLEYFHRTLYIIKITTIKYLGFIRLSVTICRKGAGSERQACEYTLVWVAASYEGGYGGTTVLLWLIYMCWRHLFPSIRPAFGTNETRTREVMDWWMIISTDWLPDADGNGINNSTEYTERQNVSTNACPCSPPLLWSM